MQLETLPFDIWLWFQDWLDGMMICRLILCGSVRLNETLFRYITSMRFNFAGSTKSLGWPPMLQRFSRLQKFYYNTALVTSSIEYFPTVADLQLLSGTLQSLKLCCDGAELMFRNASSQLHSIEDVVNQGSRTHEYTLYPDPKDWFMARERWPELKSLYLRQFSSYRAETPLFGPIVPFLPRSLHTLRVLCCDELTDEEVSALPPQLTTLDLRELPISVEQVALLPRSIETLSIRFEPRELDEVLDWPPQLTRLELRRVDENIASSDVLWANLTGLLDLHVYFYNDTSLNETQLIDRLVAHESKLIRVQIPSFSGYAEHVRRLYNMPNLYLLGIGDLDYVMNRGVQGEPMQITKAMRENGADLQYYATAKARISDAIDKRQYANEINKLAK